VDSRQEIGQQRSSDWGKLSALDGRIGIKKGARMNPKLRILIVDDDQRMTHTLADILSISGYETVEATSGSDALILIQSQGFDCVLTDIKMPGMDGLELFHQLHQAQPGLPVVLMTAYTSQDIIRRGLEEGVIGLFEKPLDINYVLGFFSSLAKYRMIAIVDDDPDFCNTLGSILQSRGFSVAPICDPHMDVEKIASNAQVILLDLKLNKISGLDILKEVKQRYPTLPVLLVTAYRQEMAIVMQAALEFQAVVCLYKPLEIPTLLQILTKLQLEHLREVINGK
jgi:CheY-like chemotaxis protein